MAGPLSGLKVVEIAGIGPAPFGGMLLADLGAEVVRVDRVGERAFQAWHQVLDRGRRSVALDLKQPAGREVLLRLVERADVLVEAFRPGVAERLGIGPRDCLERNRGLVYARMTGWGQQGPLAQTAGHDINYIALSGALHAIGRSDGPPVPPVNLLGDFAGGGMLLVNGVLAALVERQRSGEGQVVDVSIVDGTVSLLGMLLGMQTAGLWSEQRGSNLLDTGAPFYDVYPCADGKYVAVGALEEKFYAELLRGLDLKAVDLPGRDDRANWPVLRRIFLTAFASRARDEWATVFDGTDACVTPVLTAAEAAAHPHLAQRGTYVDAGGVSQPAPAPRFSRTRATLPTAAPEVGQDTVSVLRECGLSDAEASALLAAGIAGSAVAPVQGEPNGTSSADGGQLR